jgi:hypothetical protein
VDVSREELRARFREFSDEELLRHLESGTLTPLAADVASEALRLRGMQPPAAATLESAAMPAAEEENRATDLVTVAAFQNPLQANLLRACLESRGIFAYVWGEHLGMANILWSMAGGGIRVQVRSDQAVQATEIIAAFERGELELRDSPETALDHEVRPAKG